MTVARRRSPVTVGRTTEVARALAALVADEGVGGSVLAVSGEAGIGKSRTVDEVLAGLGTDVVVHRCGCHLADQVLPFGPFVDLATTDADLAHLAAVLTTAGSDGGDGDSAELRRRRAFEEIGAAVFDPDRPTVLVVEDLHWADDVSLQALGHLTRGIESTTRRFVLTYRPDEQPPGLVALLAELERRRVLDDIALAPLDADDVAAMAAAMTDVELGAEQRRRLAELSDGNPFHVEELIRSTGGDVLSSGVTVPRSVEHSVASRLAALDPETRQAAARAAVIGRDVPVDRLAALMAWDTNETAARAAELVAAGLLLDIDGERLRFVHELARRAVESELLSMERVAIHRELLGFLTESFDDGNLDERTRADLARHAFEGHEWDAAIEHGTAAAASALGRWSPAAAVTHLDRVVDAATRAGVVLPARSWILRAQAQRLIGRHAGARDDLAAAVAAADEPGCAWEARFERALLDLQDSHERGAAGLEEALTAAREWGDASAIARTLNRIGNLATNRFDFDPAIELLDEAMHTAEAAGDERVVAESGVLLLVTHSLAGDLEAARRAGAEAVERLRRLDDPVGLAQALFSMSMTVAEHSYTDQGRNPATTAVAEAEAREALAIATSMGWTAGEALSRRSVGGVLAAADRPAEAIALLRESERQAASIDHLVHTMRATVMLGDALFDVGDTQGARRAFDESIELGARMGAGAPTLSAHVREVEIDLLEGRVDEAADRLEAAIERSGPATRRLTVIATVLVTAATGRLEEALALVEEAIVEQGELDDPPPRLGEIRGDLLARLGRIEEAIAVLRRADRRAAEAGLRQRRRWIVATRARVAAMAGDREEAARLCDEAWVLTDAAAVGLEPELAALLRADMERRTSGVPRTIGHRTDGPGALTQRELEVAIVLARGLTNQQIADELFISVRTAETHVKRILSKLGFTSRGQVARWVHDQGLDRPGDAS